MSDLPAGWVKTLFGEICGSGQYGYTTKAASEGEVRFLRTTDITKGEIDWESVPFCLEEPKDIEKYLLKEKDILISRAGSVGFSTLIKNIPYQTVFASYLIRYVPEKELDARYIALFLKSAEYWSQISKVSAGIALQNINARKLANVTLPLPPSNEQIRIADKLENLLGRVDRCKERLERIPVFLERFRQSIFTAALSGELIEASGEWRKVKLDSLLTDIRYGTSKKSTYDKQGAPVLRIPNIGNGRIDANDLKYGQFSEQELAKLSLEEGDLLVIRSNGSVELVGKVALVENEFQGYVFAGYLIRLRVDKERICPSYLRIFLSCPSTRKYIESTARSTSGVNNINSTEIRAIDVILPSIVEQKEIVRRVEHLLTFVESLEARYYKVVKQVELFTPALLSKAFRGELVLQDSGDESAHKLLERFQIAKQKRELRAESSKRPKAKAASKTKANGEPMSRSGLVDSSYLTNLIRTQKRQSIEAKALWVASELSIDDFYRQLSHENSQGLLMIEGHDPAVVILQ